MAAKKIERNSLKDLTTFESVEEALKFYFEGNIGSKHFDTDNDINDIEETEKYLKERVGFIRKIAAIQYNQEEKLRDGQIAIFFELLSYNFHYQKKVLENIRKSFKNVDFLIFLDDFSQALEKKHNSISAITISDIDEDLSGIGGQFFESQNRKQFAYSLLSEKPFHEKQEILEALMEDNLGDELESAVNEQRCDLQITINSRQKTIGDCDPVGAPLEWRKRIGCEIQMNECKD